MNKWKSSTPELTTLEFTAMGPLERKLTEFAGPKRELLELMWKISEEAWHSGWQSELEFELWILISKAKGSYGQTFVDSSLTRELKRLAILTGGWIYFDEENEETWIDAESWRRMFNKWKARRQK